jgi:hypothetical protein
MFVRFGIKLYLKHINSSAHSSCLVRISRNTRAEQIYFSFYITFVWLGIKIYHIRINSSVRSLFSLCSNLSQYEGQIDLFFFFDIFHIHGRYNRGNSSLTSKY